MSKRVIYRLIWIPSAVACIVALIMFIGRPIAEAAPGPLVAYTSSDKSLQVLHPDNWKAAESGAHGVESSVKFTGGPFTAINFSTDLAGSLMADIARSPSSDLNSLPGMPNMGDQSGGGGGNPMPQQKTPLEKVHEMHGRELQNSPDLHDYTEGDTTPTRIAGVDALVTGFTYTKRSLMGEQKVVGKRATALLGDRRLLIFAYCPKDSEKQIMPIFDKMINSLQAQQGG